MIKSIFLTSVLLMMVATLAGMSAGADSVTIDMSGATPFLYEGRSYLPMRSTAGFLGAAARWDAEKGQAIMTYKGEDLVLTPNNLEALLAGQPVVLPSPPVVVSGVTYVPTEALRKFYGVPVAWDGDRSEVKIKGPSGWATVKASSRAPWHGGPPPWAPAWGQRGNEAKANNAAHLKGESKQPYAAPAKGQDEQGKGQVKNEDRGQRKDR